MVNSTAWHAQMAAYHTIHTTYYAGGFNDTSCTHNDTEYVYTEEALNVENEALKDAEASLVLLISRSYVKLYFKAVKEGDYEVRLEIASARPLIKEAYDKIGAEKMKALKYVQKKKIRDEIAIQSKFS